MITKKIILFALFISIIPFITAVTIDSTTFFNATQSSSSMTFSVTVTVDLAEIETDYIYLENITYFFEGYTRFCSSINHSAVNLTLDSTDFNCKKVIVSNGGGGIKETSCGDYICNGEEICAPNRTSNTDNGACYSDCGLCPIEIEPLPIETPPIEIEPEKIPEQKIPTERKPQAISGKAWMGNLSDVLIDLSWLWISLVVITFSISLIYILFKKRKKEHTKENHKKATNLSEFINVCLSKNLSEEKIKYLLLNAGWPKNIVDDYTKHLIKK
ncbi:hypothetical protein GOV03_02670 [Candidatus Woesearchaeota archaeon]|nr:hypothetical protein [Candidatus Woesearchaeota archaeon]